MMHLLNQIALGIGWTNVGFYGLIGFMILCTVGHIWVTYSIVRGIKKGR